MDEALATDVEVASRPIGQLALVVERVENLVFDELEPGQELPSEGALAKDLGVSRLTVREGMRQLSARGLIEVRNGRRPVVAHPNGKGIGDYFRNTIRRDPRALLDLLQVREALEVHNAYLSARSASRSSLAAMQASIDDMRKGIEDLDAFVEADVHFHELLAGATGNHMLMTLIEELADSQRSSAVRSLMGHTKLGRPLDEVVEEHTEILACIERRDQQAAAVAMAQHLSSTGKDLIAALR